MAEAAREDAPAELPAGHPEHPGNLADPSHAAWCDYRKAVMTEATAARLALEEIAAQPGNERSVKLAVSVLAAMEALAALGRRRMIDESIVAAERQRAYEQGVADCKAGRRGCLRPVPGPR